MNREEEKRLGRVELEVKNNTKQLEKIITNDLPHIKEVLAGVRGKVRVMIPLVFCCLAGIGGLYLLIINLIGG